MHKLVILITLIILLTVGVIVITKHTQTTSVSGTLHITTSFYPLYFFASQIGGEKASVTNITPAGAEPHDYEPTAQDIARIEHSNILVLNGGGLEAWGENIQKNLDPKRTRVVIAGEGLANQQLEEEGNRITDPHVWLSPSLALKMVDAIAQGFLLVDPGNTSYYETRAAALKEQLNALDQEYRHTLSTCAKHDIITSHAAFGYLALAYHLRQVSITGISPDAEPSSRQLGALADFAKKNNVKYIFFESLVSPKLAETLAREVGAHTLVLNPLEGLSDEELAQGKNYLTVMKDNLNNLSNALLCQK